MSDTIPISFSYDAALLGRYAPAMAAKLQEIVGAVGEGRAFLAAAIVSPETKSVRAASVDAVRGSPLAILTAAAMLDAAAGSLAAAKVGSIAGLLYPHSGAGPVADAYGAIRARFAGVDVLAEDGSFRAAVEIPRAPAKPERRVEIEWRESPGPLGAVYSAEVPSLYLGRPGAVSMSIEPRPFYCDRGRFVFRADGSVSLDGADMFPRYYFDLGAAKSEAAAWANARSETRAAAGLPPLA